MKKKFDRLVIELFSRFKNKKIFIGFYRSCDFITLTGSILAFIGLFLVIYDHFTLAAVLMACCGILDGLDGRVARKKKYNKLQNTYGVQLDSLSDVICFGLFPAFFVVNFCDNLFAFVVAFIYLLCGIIRLAYFNTLAVAMPKKKKVFIGVPITTGAIVFPLLVVIFRIISFDLLVFILPIFMFILGISFILKIEIPKIDVVGYLLKFINKYTVNFVIFPLLLVLFCDFYYKLNHMGLSGIYSGLLTIFNHFSSFLFILLIVILLVLFLTGLFGNSKRAYIFMFTITLIFMIINDIKMAFMDIPIRISDINYLNKENAEMMGTAGGQIGIWILVTIIKTLILILLFVFIIKLFKKYTFKFKKIYFTLLFLLFSFVSFFVIINRDYFVLKYVYNLTSNDLLEINDTSKLYDNYGFLQGLYLDNISNSYLKPNNYSKDGAKKVLKETKNENFVKWGKANVVFILSETFADAEKVNEIKFNKNLTSTLDKYSLDNDKMVFDVLVSPFGGTSVNSEFEVLTGGSLSFFKEGFVPYTQYYNEKNGVYAPHVIHEFKNNGYSTMYLTPWGTKSYRSEYVYNLIGADKKIYGFNLHGKKKGRYYSDKSFMDDIYNNLKDTKKGKYKFIMAATGQNHFPYGEEKYSESEYDIKIKKTSFNKEDSGMLLSYAQGIYDADKYLDYLHDKIEDLDVPTIIVFFGDHLPSMTNSKGENVYLTSSYFNTKDENLNEIRKHTTKGAILANFKLDISDDLKFINSSYLGAYVLNKMDLKISDYFKFVDYSRKIVPVFNRNVVYDINDKKIVSLKNLSKVKYKDINNYKNVQNYAFNDR